MNLEDVAVSIARQRVMLAKKNIAGLDVFFCEEEFEDRYSPVQNVELVIKMEFYEDGERIVVDLDDVLSGAEDGPKPGEPFQTFVVIQLS